jgi:ketosteroid isomerase-like protein
MSQENVEIAVKQFEGTNARDFGGVMDTWADDVTLIVHWLAGQGSDTATGKAAVGEWFGDWFRQFGRDYRFDIEETHDSGERVFVLVTHHGRGRHSGVTVEQRVAHVYTLRVGKVTRIEVWAEEGAREAALEAVGLAE